MKQQSNAKNLIQLSISIMIFGTIGVIRKFIPYSSGLIAFFRGTLGGLLIIVFLKIKRGNVFSGIKGKTLLTLIVTGGVMGINWIMLFEAYNYTSVSVATLCYYLEPTFIIISARIFFKEKMSVKKWICAVVSLIGMVFVSGVFNLSEVSTNNLIGVLLGIGSAILYAGVVLINKKMAGTDVYSRTVIELLSAGGVMIPYLLFTEDFSALSFSAVGVILILTVSLIHTGFAYCLYFGAVDKLKPHTIAMFSYIDPVLALILSAIILGERFDVFGIIGAVLILGSAFISEFKRKNNENIEHKD